ncbi:hypothetical protein F8M41_010703 [Gigaspora margarita]|uniref:Uncharacterized protein n=1 Tax=Gigaspora margarita TaxID=4874 RepID=A0A8H3X0C2_GIGMA|nr:hypothetical protein F8M41_010703 [Gigaspora margarita]
MTTKPKVTTKDGSKVKEIGREKKMYLCENTDKTYHAEITNPKQLKRQELKSPTIAPKRRSPKTPHTMVPK